MYCSECGKPAQGKFCSNCGTPLAAPTPSAPPPAAVYGPPAPTAAVSIPAASTAAIPIQFDDEPVGDWEHEVRYEVLMRIPELRATVERHAAMAKKGMTGEEFTRFGQQFLPGKPPLDKLVTVMQPLYARWGIATGKDRIETIDAPVGRVMIRVLCSLARNSRPLRSVKQAIDGCYFEAILPSDPFSLEGEFSVSVQRQQSKTVVSAAAKIKGQLYDWGKSRRSLDDFFADLQLDPGIGLPGAREAA